MTTTRSILVAAVVLTAMLGVGAPPASAGGHVGLHFGIDNLSITVGIGDWAVYGRSWHDPRWQLDFHAALAGYGEWVWVDGLGRCWRPWVAASWQPYSHGRWVLTGRGWTWVAYEPWGYVPHHYGNWAYSSFGWVWVPGYAYHTANVIWVRTSAYVGWYARPPHGWSHAAHGYRTGYGHGYRDGYRDGWLDARYGTWVDWRHFCAENIAQRRVSYSTASRHRIDHAAAAPAAVEVRRRSVEPVVESRLETRSVRSAGRTITVARPADLTASLERNAADTIRTALSATAIQRRQPLANSGRYEPPATRSRAIENARLRGGARPATGSERPLADRAPATSSSIRSPSIVNRRALPASPRFPESAPGRVDRTTDSAPRPATMRVGASISPPASSNAGPRRVAARPEAASASRSQRAPSSVQRPLTVRPQSSVQSAAPAGRTRGQSARANPTEEPQQRPTQRRTARERK